MLPDQPIRNVQGRVYGIDAGWMTEEKATPPMTVNAVDLIASWTTGSRRARIGLNKGEAHHALKNTLRIGLQGEKC